MPKILQKLREKMSGELAERILIREHKRIPKFDNANLEVSMVYPGSPLFIRHMLRQQDRLISCELHPEEYSNLKKLLRKDVHNIDGYLALKAFLPFNTNCNK